MTDLTLNEREARDLRVGDFIAAAQGTSYSPAAEIDKVDISEPGWIWIHLRGEWSANWLRFTPYELITRN